MTIKAQRDDALAKQCMEMSSLGDVEQCFNDEDDKSEAYVSSVEGFNDKSDDDDDVLYQLCEPEPVVERTQVKSTRVH